MFGKSKPDINAAYQPIAPKEQQQHPPVYTAPPPHQDVWHFRCLESVRARQEGSAIEAAPGQFLPGKYKGGKINLVFVTHPIETGWEANVDISVKSLPESMRQGWSWSGDNIDPAGGQLIVNSSELHEIHRYHGWYCGRRYKLVDRAEDPQWEAVVWVYARNLQSLSRVKLDMLSHDKVYMAWATNENNRISYTFHGDGPYNFNAIYDDMPLGGWWPWPRVDEAGLGEDGFESIDQVELSDAGSHD